MIKIKHCIDCLKTKHQCEIGGDIFSIKKNDFMLSGVIIKSWNEEEFISDFLNDVGSSFTPPSNCPYYMEWLLIDQKIKD